MNGLYDGFHVSTKVEISLLVVVVHADHWPPSGLEGRERLSTVQEDKFPQVMSFESVPVRAENCKFENEKTPDGSSKKLSELTSVAHSSSRLEASCSRLH